MSYINVKHLRDAQVLFLFGTNKELIVNTEKSFLYSLQLVLVTILSLTMKP